MSANPPSEWNYWVDYDPDISAALQRLREDVFARGDYAAGDSAIRLQAAPRLRLRWQPGVTGAARLGRCVERL